MRGLLRYDVTNYRNRTVENQRKGSTRHPTLPLDSRILTIRVCLFFSPHPPSIPSQQPRYALRRNLGDAEGLLFIIESLPTAGLPSFIPGSSRLQPPTNTHPTTYIQCGV
ncbi:uncharacterized protein LAJ45_02424 [Morchella importuna]|uniref:uncharacterized protein n=1 Tax=Morchella importuna TaxID=1174673 RepID=UPI001E8EE450|nr:uncharacterized protein LAJ45_02424 [Morchella importuna]KAH8153611.1 hypothetical protein LAJ45_02424 [Morchella importuna]